MVMLYGKTAALESSCPRLTRASILLPEKFFKQMDCRVKPGNDESVVPIEPIMR
jgi:hypothetical protein